jgi:hypothetical protein
MLYDALRQQGSQVANYTPWPSPIQPVTSAFSPKIFIIVGAVLLASSVVVCSVVIPVYLVGRQSPNSTQTTTTTSTFVCISTEFILFYIFSC